MNGTTLATTIIAICEQIVMAELAALIVGATWLIGG